MGMIENPPADTSAFYHDGYYGGEEQAEIGYADYAFTAEHALLWVRLLVQALIKGGRVLDVGCADGFMLRNLGAPYELTALKSMHMLPSVHAMAAYASSGMMCSLTLLAMSSRVTST
ncbi:hypothetical protein AWV79_15090 [Cupriavidus sp. UYMMa02A]|nr:hypothetical protein AWV79_15090 [Cupriavidus sp. UYMMa02A]